MQSPHDSSQPIWVDCSVRSYPDSNKVPLPPCSPLWGDSYPSRTVCSWLRTLIFHVITLRLWNIAQALKVAGGLLMLNKLWHSESVWCYICVCVLGTSCFRVWCIKYIKYVWLYSTEPKGRCQVDCFTLIVQSWCSKFERVHIPMRFMWQLKTIFIFFSHKTILWLQKTWNIMHDLSLDYVTSYPGMFTEGSVAINICKMIQFIQLHL